MQFIKTINLSKFDISSVNNMKGMFYNCNSLKVIDLSNFNMENVKSYDDMFINISNIRYINLYNTKNDKSIGTSFNEIDNNFIVCQQENMITNPKSSQICCDFNIETYMCESKNYITLYYNEDCNYTNHFINKYRNDIYFIINGYDNSTITGF